MPYRKVQATKIIISVLVTLLLLWGVIVLVPFAFSKIPSNIMDNLSSMLYSRHINAFDPPEYNRLSVRKDNHYELSDSSTTPGEAEIPDDEDAILVASINLSHATKSEKPDVIISNQTSFKVSAADYLKKEYPFIHDDIEGPVVLVYHTHTSEAYAENDYYYDGDMFRSSDSTKNVVAAGVAFCSVLQKNGINVIHETTVFDNKYDESYKSSAAMLKEYKEKYPSLLYAIDIHRDSVTDSENKQKKPLTTFNNESVAQIMLVIGTNEGGGVHPDWEDNLTAAVKYQEILNDLYPTLARPINLRTATFNQSYFKGSMLLEIGAGGNTVKEASAAAILAAEAFVKLYNT